MRLGPKFASMVVLVALLHPFSLSAAEDDRAGEFPGPSHYLRTAIQGGTVLQTNSFLEGDNASGEPIDHFNSVRLDFGWQTDGSQDWHHTYNFPSYGLGIYGADLYSDELGTPTSLYGFFVWPLHRGHKWRFNFDLNFGFTNDWKAYDPVNNPQQVAMGLGRSVHIEGGPNAEYFLSDRWSLIGGFTFTHFSNGGTQRPNEGINQIGPILYVKYATDEPTPPPARRRISEYPRNWDLTVTASAGKRNLDLRITDPDQATQYLNKSYFIGDLTVGLGRQFSCKSRYVFGLDFCYDGTVGDLAELDAYNNQQPSPDTGFWNYWDVAVFGGYELVANRTHLLVHFAYKLIYDDLPNRLPTFYQRLGVKQFVYRNWFVGLNVRFHELGSADNLEWNMGYKVDM